MEEKVSNTIFIHQQTIYELEKLKDKKSIVNYFAYFEDDTELLEFLEYLDED